MPIYICQSILGALETQVISDMIGWFSHLFGGFFKHLLKRDAYIHDRTYIQSLFHTSQKKKNTHFIKVLRVVADISTRGGILHGQKKNV